MAVVSVFVSSTFRDFHGERDALVGPVRAVLDERLAAYGCRVEVVDLRWGVAAGDDGLTDEERQRRVLDVCLGEIDRSRPLFLGLVGMRYGWVPPLSRVRRVAAEAGLERIDLTDRSVTALEIEHGVFSRSDIDAVLLVRDAVGELPAGWQDADTGPIEALRERVFAWDGGQVHTYQVATDGRRVVDLSAFEALAIEVLGPLVERRARKLIAERPDPYSAAQERFFEDRGGVVAGRDRVLDEVVAAVEAGVGRCLIGVSGVGKSAVWCAAVSRLGATGQRVITLVVGVAPDSTSLAAAVRILAGQLGHEVPAGLDEEKLRDWFRGVLTAAGPLVVAVDGLDGLDAGDVRERLPFLMGLPASTTVLVSTTSETQATLLERVGVAPVVLSDLTAAQVPGVIDALLGQIRRQLPRAAIDALAEAPRTPLWLSLAFGELLVLDEDDFAALDVTLDPAMALDALLVDTVLGLPSDVEDLIHRILDRVEERFGRDVVSDALGLLAVSRSGLTQLDLVELTGYDELTLAGIRRGLRALVSVRGVGGRLGFAHGVVAEVLTARYAREPTWLHTRLAGHLHASSERDAVREDDLLWHLLYADGEPTPALVLNRLTPFTPEAERAAMVLTDAYRHAAPSTERLNRLNGSGIRWLLGVTEDLSEGHIGVAELDKLAIMALMQARRLAAENPRSTRARDDLSMALKYAGDVALRMNQMGRSTELCEESLQIARQVVAAEPAGIDAGRSLLVVLDSVGSIFEASGKLDRVVQVSEEALELARRHVAVDSMSATTRLRNLSISLQSVGRVAEASGKVDRAVQVYDEALEAARYAAATDTTDVEVLGEVLRGLLVSLLPVGRVALRRGGVGRAAQVYDEALDLARALVAADPASARTRRDLMGALVSVGQVAEQMADFDRAALAYDEALRLARGLATDDPANTDAERELSLALTTVGDLALRLGRVERAKLACDEALERARDLVATDRVGARTRRHLWITLCSVGRVAASLGQTDHAGRVFDESLGLARALAADEPDSAEARRDLLVSLLLVGNLAYEGGHLRRAEPIYGEALLLARELAAAEPDSSRARRDLCSALQNNGRVLEASGQLERAVWLYDEALGIARGLTAEHTTDAEARRVLSITLNSAGRLALNSQHVEDAELVFGESLYVLSNEGPTALSEELYVRLFIDASTGLADARLASHRDREAAVGLADAVEYLLDHPGVFADSDAAKLLGKPDEVPVALGPRDLLTAQLLGKLDEVRVALGPRDLLLSRRCRRLVKRLLST